MVRMSFIQLVGILMIFVGGAFIVAVLQVGGDIAPNAAEQESVARIAGYSTGIVLSLVILSCMGLVPIILGGLLILRGDRISKRFFSGESTESKSKRRRPRRYPPKRGYDESSDSYY